MTQGVFKMDVRSNIRQTVIEMHADIAKADKATVMALNKTIVQLGTEAGREIRKVYNLKLKAIRKAMKLLKARNGSKYPRAELTFSGRPIPLIEFGARQNATGVSVKILKQGGRKTVPHAFITELTRNNARGGGSAGIQNVFRRVGRARLPIKNLRSVSIPVMAERAAIAKTLEAFADERYDRNFDQALSYLLLRG